MAGRALLGGRAARAANGSHTVLAGLECEHVELPPSGGPGGVPGPTACLCGLGGKRGIRMRRR